MTETLAPVFVVGIPRSGTTLLSAMLSAHSRLDCGPESRLLARLRHLGSAEQQRLLEPRTWPAPATAFIDGLEDRGHGIIGLFGLSRSDIHAWLAARPPSIAAMMESLTAQHAERAGKARWVEKTPRHLLTLDTIRGLWPEASVIRIVRDPRDVAVSLVGVPFAAETQVGNLVRIDYDDRRSRHFFAADARSITLRYEDLVRRPERELRRVCGSIGEGFEPGMLDPSGSADGVRAGHEWWKASVGEGLDTSRAGRWRSEMPDDVQRFAALHLARYIREHGYEGARKPSRRVAVVPIGDAVTARDERLLLDLSRRDMVTLRPSPRWASDLRRQRSVVFFGTRGQLDPLRNGAALDRVTNTAGLAVLLLLRRLRRRSVLWVRRATLRERDEGDPGEIVVALLLRLLARTVEPGALAGSVAGS